MSKPLFAGLMVLLIGAAVYGISALQQPPTAVVTAGSFRVQTKTCQECHEQIAENFRTAPHSRTLRRGTDPVVMDRFVNRETEIDGRTFRFFEQDGELWFTADDLDYARRVDWVFGSGEHAMTPVSLDTDPQGLDRLTQLHLSWYGDDQLHPTPGSPRIQTVPPRLGRTQSADDTERCFGCHVSWLPKKSDSRQGHVGTAGIDFEHMVPNLDCSRCHSGAAAHAASEGTEPLDFSWADLTALESINRCGECHRRADEMTPEELTPQHTHIVRFAPVGMALSPCFRGANSPQGQPHYPRFDCLSCHDPHLPTRSDAESFNSVCRQCHTPHDSQMLSPSPRITCSQRPLSSSCIECHMPKKAAGPGLEFTDHWIRSPDLPTQK
ncbi:hypothetical protein [Roseimaritima ulvae]|uniref:Doubled CXXCH motif (Paired_CXXCH_1) n=1 Tax=Roseimaritima ulvae TaxID=980254 RepID=A0A5B9QK86_9BACT|nr:hypothetical protein [Roseimaritima ulvae]QEG38152.1 Doubled CXXCH motif (Paired_CXXCH_1) [Roseimaritima ulvae]